jgi:hypothetical protein
MSSVDSQNYISIDFKSPSKDINVLAGTVAKACACIVNQIDIEIASNHRRSASAF